MVKTENFKGIKMYGGRLCLNFINTIHDRKEEVQDDYLENISDLISWSYSAGSIDEQVKGKLLEKAVSDKNKMDTFFTEAIHLRELLHQTFISIIEDEKPDKSIQTRLNAAMKKYFTSIHLTINGQSIKEETDLPEDHVNRLLVPVLKDTFLLITRENLGRIKECPKCGWLFYDTSKNGKRKWCSMKSCGSQAKALEWYHRKKIE